MKIYVIGGKEKNGINEEWNQYNKGMILKLDTQNDHVESCVQYTSPPNMCPQINPSILFKSGTVFKKKLYVCTQTEILIYSLPDFKRTGYISIPCFNDLHHVRPTHNGTILIANTGLDMVLEVTEKGNILREWSVLNENPWNRFSREVDYRKIPTTKPHKSHPNYVFQIGNDIWVTRCIQQDAVCLTQPSRRIAIGGSMIHDGVIFNDSIYFTRVVGHIVVADLHHYKIKNCYDLNKITNSNEPLGWCRGLKVIDDHNIIVGFSRLRPTKVITDDGTVKTSGNFGVKATHIACYNIQKNQLVWQYNIEKDGINAVYSIHTEDE